MYIVCKTDEQLKTDEKEMSRKKFKVLRYFQKAACIAAAMTSVDC